MARCRWCGQESSHPQVCEWCRRDLATGALVRTLPPNPAANPASPVQPPPAGVPPADPISSQPTQSVPTPPSSQPTQAIPSQPQPLYDYSRPAAPTATQPADTVKFLYEVSEGYTFTAKLERFFGLVLPLTALNVLILAWKPEWALWSNISYFLLVGIWLPVSHLVDKLDDVEMFRDLGIVVLLNILCCNPVVPLVLYGLAVLAVWAITRADINWSLLGVLLIYTLLRVLFDMVLILIDYSDPADWLRVGIAFAGSFPLFAMLLGWIIGGMFRAD